MSVQDRIDDYWTRRAPSYDADQHRPERDEQELRVWSQVWSDTLPSGHCDVLDLGTGSGYVALALAALGHRVTGIDRAEGMLEVARTHAERQAATGLRPPTFLLRDAVDPDLPDASFDAVCGRYVMWTLREPERAMARWRRLLRPGGLLALVDSTWFPQGVAGHGGDAFESAYDAEVRGALPLAEATSIEATVAMLDAGGFTSIETTALHAVLALDLEHGAAPGHEVRTQYLVTARV